MGDRPNNGTATYLVHYSLSLISRYLDLGGRDDTRFLVVSSDVIYPAAAIEDYERNFYLPFQGSLSRSMQYPETTTVTMHWKGSMRLPGAEGGPCGVSPICTINTETPGGIEPLFIARVNQGSQYHFYHCGTVLVF